MGLETRPQKVLDFDIETRLVGFYSAGKFQPAGCEPTAIAWSWFGQKKVHVLLQKEEAVVWGEQAVPKMIEAFRPFYDEADMVTGHYITRFDLPILNGMCLEFKLPLLGAKLAHDTKTHMVKKAGFSASQENLSAMFGLSRGKFHLSDHDWRGSTRLWDEGVEITRRRVMDDVKQHKELYEEMCERGALKSPKIWRP